MATIQAKKVNGYKYWYIVESRRVNGKPRPIVLAYLGKAEDLLERLNQSFDAFKLKSYSHGGVASMLKIAIELDIVNIINKYIWSEKTYRANKPIRHELTSGITILLGAIGRICMPTSKQGWWSWAQTTSAEYLLRCSLNKIDSQHFWDLMDSLPANHISGLENELIKKVQEHYSIFSGTLLYDTTNFFTYIHTTNQSNTIAQRGKNKQKRNDLRQVGMALVVTHGDSLPVFHFTYQGNRHDSVIFNKLIKQLHQRLNDLGLAPAQHTVVFDQGNNSKENLYQLRQTNMYYVGALSPWDHQSLIANAGDKYQEVHLTNSRLQVARQKADIWGRRETILIFVSDRLKAGQIRGIYQSLDKKVKQLQELQQKLASNKARKRKRASLEKQINNIIKGQYMKGVFEWSLQLKETANQNTPKNSSSELPEEGHFLLHYHINYGRLKAIEKQMGFRVLMTNRHQWDSARIIEAYFGQSTVEGAFRDMKNPHHLAVRPQYHWTDQKIRVHFFICVLGYLLATLVWKRLNEKTGYNKSINTMLNTLNNIRLGTILEDTKKPGKLKAHYKLEEMDKEQRRIMEALNLTDFHLKRPKIDGLGVYR